MTFAPASRSPPTEGAGSCHSAPRESVVRSHSFAQAGRAFGRRISRLGTHAAVSVFRNHPIMRSGSTRDRRASPSIPRMRTSISLASFVGHRPRSPGSSWETAPPTMWNACCANACRTCWSSTTTKMQRLRLSSTERVDAAPSARRAAAPAGTAWGRLSIPQGPARESFLQAGPQALGSTRPQAWRPPHSPLCKPRARPPAPRCFRAPPPALRVLRIGEGPCFAPATSAPRPPCGEPGPADGRPIRRRGSQTRTASARAASRRDRCAGRRPRPCS